MDEYRLTGAASSLIGVWQSPIEGRTRPLAYGPLLIVLSILGSAAPASTQTPSAVSSTVKLAESCGVYADGHTDDTVKIQHCLDQLPDGWTLDGEGKTYAVRRLALKSNITIQHFHLTAMPSGAQFDAPITIDGTTSAKSGIVVRDVSVDGNRILQSGMDSQPQEDGGRSCFRVIGEVANLLLQRVHGEYCATDGLELFGGSLSGSDADDSLKLRNIVVRDSQFYYNRRHGVSGDSLYKATFINVASQFNGLDVPGSEAEGAKGSRFKGRLYGTGLDFEGYGVGSALSGLLLIDISATENAGASLTFKDSANPAEANFRPRRNIIIVGGRFDVGRFPYAPEPFALTVAAERKNVGKSPQVYENVSVIGAEIQGALVLGSVKDATLTKVIFRAVRNYPYWGLVSNVPGMQYSAITTGDLKLYSDDSVPPRAGVVPR